MKNNMSSFLFFSSLLSFNCKTLPTYQPSTKMKPKLETLIFKPYVFKPFHTNLVLTACSKIISYINACAAIFWA